MQKSFISGVKDGMALINGRWLPFIGNLSVDKGDIVWNDGRCIYGNSIEGGGSIVATVSDAEGIPLLQKYWNGHESMARHQGYIGSGIKNLTAEKYVGRCFVSRGDKIQFTNNAVLDAEIDSNGNLYTLENGYILCDLNTGICTMSGGEIKRNGEVIKKYNLALIAEEYIQEARRWAEGRTQFIKGDNPQNDTHYETAICYPLSGRIDSQGNYMLVVFLQVTVSNRKYAYEESPYSGSGAIYNPSHNYGIRGNAANKEIFTRFLYDGKNRYEWFYKARCYWSYYVSWGLIALDSSEESEERFATAWSLKYPISDGYYITFSGEAEYKPMLFSDDLYAVHIHKPSGEIILSAELQPIFRINICQIAKEKFLLQNGDNLYVFTNGKVTQKLSGYSDTLRLRRMKHINKWKKKGDV